MGLTTRHPQTLCWYCQNTNRFKCSWFDPDNQQPVPGWTAEKDYRNGVGDTFHVIECPNFLPVDEDLPTAETQQLPTGVRYRRDAGRWVATIHWKRRHYYLGMFDDQNKAISARRAAEEAIERGDEPRRNIRR